MVWLIIIVLSAILIGMTLGWIAIPVVSLHCKHCHRQIGWLRYGRWLAKETGKTMIFPNHVANTNWCPCGHINTDGEAPKDIPKWLRETITALMLVAGGLLVGGIVRMVLA